MKEIVKEKPLDITEALVDAYSSYDDDLSFIVEYIRDYDYCRACSEIEEAIKNFIKKNIVKYGSEHKKKMMFNNVLLKAFNNEKNKKSSMTVKYNENVTFNYDLAEFRGVNEQELNDLDEVLESMKEDLLKNISIKEIVNLNKEEIITAIKMDKELKKYVEDVVDYALDFDSIINSEKKELEEFKNKPVNYDELDEDEKEDNDSYIRFTEGFIDFLDKQNIDKDYLVELYSNELINKTLCRVLDDNYLDDVLSFKKDKDGKSEKEELIAIVTKDLEKNPLDIDIDDVIDYYNELSKELERKGIFIPVEDYMIHLIRKVYDDNYEISIDAKEFDSYFDGVYDEYDAIDDMVRDRVDYENHVLGSKHKSKGYRKI